MRWEADGAGPTLTLLSRTWSARKCNEWENSQKILNNDKFRIWKLTSLPHGWCAGGSLKYSVSTSFDQIFFLSSLKGKLVLRSSVHDLKLFITAWHRTFYDNRVKHRHHHRSGSGRHGFTICGVGTDGQALIAFTRPERVLCHCLICRLPCARTFFDFFLRLCLLYCFANRFSAQLVNTNCAIIS